MDTLDGRCDQDRWRSKCRSAGKHSKNMCTYISSADCCRVLLLQCNKSHTMARLRHAHKKAELGATQIVPWMHHCSMPTISMINLRGACKDETRWGEDTCLFSSCMSHVPRRYNKECGVRFCCSLSLFTTDKSICFKRAQIACLPSWPQEQL